MSPRRRVSITILVTFGIAGVAVPAGSQPSSEGTAEATSRAGVREPSTPELIQRAEDAGEIDAETADLYRAYALSPRWRMVPERYTGEGPWEGTLLLLDLRRDVRRMEPGPERRTIRELIGEAHPPGGPDDCGSSTGDLPNSIETPRFYVEYGTIGGGLSIANYTASLEAAWNAEVTSFGWAAPPVAPNPAPNNKYHVRIVNFGTGLYGFVHHIGTHAGIVYDNPNTWWNDVDAHASCMAVNADMSPFPGTSQQALDATTAHELTHSLQYGYGALHGPNRPDRAFTEGIATWMEDEVFDAANDNYYYLWPDVTQDMGEYIGRGVSGGPFPYPYWLTFRGLTERYGTGTAGGGEQVMQDFWELTSQNPYSSNQLPALNQALVNRGTNLADAFHAYAIALFYLRPCGGGFTYPHCFEEAAGYATRPNRPTAQGNVSSVGGTFSGNVRDGYALNWVTLPTSGPYDVSVRNTSTGGQLRVTFGCLNSSGLNLTTSQALGAGQAFTQSSFTPTPAAGSCSDPVAVITNQTQTEDNPPAQGSLRSYQVSTAPATRMLVVTRKGKGKVTGSPAGISCGSDCSEAYEAGTRVTLTAKPRRTTKFKGWRGACSGKSKTCTITLAGADQSVKAIFVKRRR